MLCNIKMILEQDFLKAGLSKRDSAILAKSAFNTYEKYKNLLDPDFEMAFLKNNSDKKESIDIKSDRLTELGYTKFLKENNLNISKPNGKNGLDIKLDDIDGWGEYKSIRVGRISKYEKVDFISRITNGLSKKFVATQKNREANKESKNYISEKQPVILFFELNKEMVDKFSGILKNDAISEKLPLILQALFPVNENCDMNKLFENKNGNSIELPRRYFTDRELELSDNGKIYICDSCSISAVVFSETITNLVFDEVLEEKWKNDLLLVHNPFARNPIKSRLFPTLYEYECKFIEVDKKFVLKEIHSR